MDSLSTRIYVRILKHFYIESVLFFAVIALFVFNIGNLFLKMFLLMLFWGIGLVIRGSFFDVSRKIRNHIQKTKRVIEENFAKKSVTAEKSLPLQNYLEKGVTSKNFSKKD